MTADMNADDDSVLLIRCYISCCGNRTVCHCHYRLVQQNDKFTSNCKYRPVFKAWLLLEAWLMVYKYNMLGPQPGFESQLVFKDLHYGELVQCFCGLH